MAFDAGMLACALSEIRNKCMGARVEKVYQPEGDEIILNLRSHAGSFRLLINAGSNNPRIGLTSVTKENPQNPPMFCMLLRKHIQGARLAGISQAGFDRVGYLEFDSRDEMGFEAKKYLIAEMMGKYSNLIFTDADMKIISALKTKDFSLDSKRQLLMGAMYSLPPTQGKINPLETDYGQFAVLLECGTANRRGDKFITDSFSGIAPSVAREIVFMVSGKTDTLLENMPADLFFTAFRTIADSVSEEKFSPCIVYNNGNPVEYSYIRLNHYGFEIKEFGGAGELFDTYFQSRDNEQRVRQRAADILKLLSNAKSRLEKKIDIQTAEIADCERFSVYKKHGDLITANIYRLKKGEVKVRLEDYESPAENGGFEIAEVELDARLTPAQNAQRYYKKYSKSKTAKIELAHQIEIAKGELEYISGVAQSLDRAETPGDLLEIRDELYRSGYASKMKSYAAPKQHNLGIMQFETPDGMTVLCGKNNLQNEHITHKSAGKTDYWFHAKGTAGSHTVLLTKGETPTDRDFTVAAEIAAYYSKAQGNNIAVDYTQIKHLKKPAGAKPGFVIYHTNYTAYVTPDADFIAGIRNK